MARIPVYCAFSGVRPVISIEFKAKCGVKGFFESGVHGPHVCLPIRGEFVEGQRASMPVQIDSYLGATFEIYTCPAFFVVPHSSIVNVVAKNPGRAVFPEFAFFASPSSADPSVSDTKIEEPLELHLPVTTASQSVPAEHLVEAVKSLGMKGVGLLLKLKCHLPVVLGQDEPSVCCVRIQRELVSIWWRG